MTNPRLRPLEPTWIEYEGQTALVLRDRLGIAETIVVPEGVALILSLCDGLRDAAAIAAALALQQGVQLPAQVVQDILDQLDAALVLEGPTSQRALAQAVAEYRAAPHRAAALADAVYPVDPAELTRVLIDFARRDQRGALPLGLEAPAPSDRPRGLVSPHIDYERGGPLYARTWLPAAGPLRDADLVVIFGTDHVGGLGRVTLTAHDFATPYGVLRTDRDLVEALAGEFGDDLHAEEFHHRNEHSIELAAVWLHHVIGGADKTILPVLCGSFAHYTHGGRAHADMDLPDRFVTRLRALTADRRVFAVAAADLAHVGPNFGDPTGWGRDEREALRASDRRLAETICRGSPTDFLADVVASRDRHRVCGLPPIYLTLRYLGETRGELTGYAHCPADAQDQSLVSIAGFWLL